MLNMYNRWRNSAWLEHFATDWITSHARHHGSTITGRPARMLDIGLGSARDLLSVRSSCADDAFELYGIESQEHCINNARAHAIQTFSVDIEREPIPTGDEFFDVVLANHVIEHTKELFWIFSEISRVLAHGGIAIIGCPNLGSWHNRMALLLGQQPPGMKTLGPHVRGITRSAFRQFIECEGFFKLEAYKGSNFYPFPAGAVNRALAATLPTLCASNHFLIRRTSKAGLFLQVLDSGVAGVTDTPYFRGPKLNGAIVS